MISTKYLLITSIAILFTVCGCASSNSVSSDRTTYGNTVIIDNPDLSLDSYLRRLSGVQVMGSGSNMVINIRGARSVKLDTRPLIIIDGTPIGKDFSRAYHIINMRTLHSVSVIPLRRATQLYGSEGNSGAIVFTNRNI